METRAHSLGRARRVQKKAIKTKKNRVKLKNKNKTDQEGKRRKTPGWVTTEHKTTDPIMNSPRRSNILTPVCAEQGARSRIDQNYTVYSVRSMMRIIRSFSHVHELDVRHIFIVLFSSPSLPKGGARCSKDRDPSFPQ